MFYFPQNESDLVDLQRGIIMEKKNERGRNVASVVFSHETGTKGGEDALITALEGKYDALRDKLIADSLMQQVNYVISTIRAASRGKIRRPQGQAHRRLTHATGKLCYIHCQRYLDLYDNMQSLSKIAFDLEVEASMTGWILVEIKLSLTTCNLCSDKYFSSQYFPQDLREWLTLIRHTLQKVNQTFKDVCSTELYDEWMFVVTDWWIRMAAAVGAGETAETPAAEAGGEETEAGGEVRRGSAVTGSRATGSGEPAETHGRQPPVRATEDQGQAREAPHKDGRR